MPLNLHTRLSRQLHCTCLIICGIASSQEVYLCAFWLYAHFHVTLEPWFEYLGGIRQFRLYARMKALLRIGRKVSVIHIIWIPIAKIIRIVWIPSKTSVLFGYSQNIKKSALQQDCGHMQGQSDHSMRSRLRSTPM